MQSTTNTPVRARGQSNAGRRGMVHKSYRKLDRFSSWGDAVATAPLALLTVILFALVFDAMVA